MPRVTRSMYHKELQSSYRIGRIIIWLARRNWGLRLMNFAMMRPIRRSDAKGLANDEMQVPSKATPGHSIRTKIYKPLNTKEPLVAMLYAHGGGYQMGVPEQAHPFFQDIIARRDIAIFAPAYRLSVIDGAPYPAGLNDCFDTLMWMKENAAELGIRDDKFIIAGHSGGGGMAAALTLKVTDMKAANIAFQMPVYAMLDCRAVTESSGLEGTLIWDKDANARGWDNYLGHLKTSDIDEYASPALRKDYRNLPPAISFVGDLEPFKDEVINFMKSLEEAGIETRFKLFEGGTVHAFEVLAPKSSIGMSANKFQLDCFEEFFDTYV